MNKYELKYMLETMTSCVDRLTDSQGKQTHHISELWTEIGEKQNIITNQRYEIKKLKERLLEIFRKEQELSRLDIAKTGEFWKKQPTKLKSYKKKLKKEGKKD